MRSTKLSIIAIVLVQVVCLNAYSQKFKNLALTPPMGWNSWNKFGCNVNENIIRHAADAMVSSGMKEAGYSYILIDDCWQAGRDSLGFIVADPEKFPSGIKTLADYVHSKGLKFGIYSCAGRKTCGNRPGSRGHEFQDAMSYANWGVDYLKYDWCNTEGQNAPESYSLMRDALYEAGRPIVFSICEWGLSKPWEWAAETGHLWRTTGDIRNNWDIPDAKEGKCWAGGVLINLDMQQGLEKYAGPGHWNDPDMLEVGNGGLSDNEARSHFSLWCMLAAPLIAGNDLTQMDLVSKDILINQDMIDIDQDRLGKQGYKIKDYGEVEVYYKPLSNSDMAICFFNRLDYPIQIKFDWTSMSLSATRDSKPLMLVLNIDRKDIYIDGQYSIRNVWQKESVGTTSHEFVGSLQDHDVIVLLLSPVTTK
jgi:alpha-galactosidase